jgi:hypothetical protein
MAKDFRKTPLVVVKALLGFVIHSANVDHDVAGFEDCRIAAALKS